MDPMLMLFGDGEEKRKKMLPGEPVAVACVELFWLHGISFASNSRLSNVD
jgi:hypothetical protein